MFSKKLTGYHVLAIFVSAFAIIISVNLTMAFQAVNTFSGLETGLTSKNTYKISQSFDEDRDAQEALGWTVSAGVEGGQLVLRIDDALGPVIPVITSATFGRATHVRDDITPDFFHNGSAFVADLPEIDGGNWNLRLTANAPDGTPFRQRIVMWVTS